MGPRILGGEVAAAGVQLLHEAAAVGEDGGDDRPGANGPSSTSSQLPFAPRLAEQQELSVDRVDRDVDVPVVVEVGRGEAPADDARRVVQSRRRATRGCELPRMAVPASGSRSAWTGSALFATARDRDGAVREHEIEVGVVVEIDP